MLAQARSPVLRFGGENIVLGGTFFNYMFEKNFYEHNKTWE